MRNVSDTFICGAEAGVIRCQVMALAHTLVPRLESIPAIVATQIPLKVFCRVHLICGGLQSAFHW